MKLTIERLGHLGDAVATGPEGSLFLPGFLPGEEIEGDAEGGFRIVTPSADRVRPPCAHARTCGGCIMQHAANPFVADWKLGIVQGALAGQGLTATFRPILTSPPQSRRRATVAAKRTKNGAMIGFHMRGSETLVAVPNCQLLHPDLIAGFAGLEAIVKIGSSRVGEVAITITRSLSGMDVMVTGGKPLDSNLNLELARITESSGFARLTWNGETVALRTAPMQRFGRALVSPPPGAFLQATLEGEAALLASIVDAIGPARKIADLFAGVGTFALALAENCEVFAYEGEAPMIAALDKGARNTQGLKRVVAQTRDLFRRPLEPDEFKGIDAVVIDPPRAGAEAQMTVLAKSDVPVIASVSCNPITFARDAKILISGGYHLDWVQVVDQFRWSHHVEMVARFSKSH